MDSQSISTYATLISAILMLGTVYYSSKVVKESKKDRYINFLPFIKVTEMKRRKNEKDYEYYADNPPVQFKEWEVYVKKHPEHFYISYEIVDKNKSMAFIKSVILYVGNGANIYREIKLEGHYEKVLFPGEQDDIFYWDVNSPEDIDSAMFPKEVKIVYEDMWGHTITYVGKDDCQISGETLPFLGLKNYISHFYEFDKKIK